MACSIRRRWFPCLRASPNAGFGTMYAAEYTRSPRRIAPLSTRSQAVKSWPSHVGTRPSSRIQQSARPSGGDRADSVLVVVVT